MTADLSLLRALFKDETVIPRMTTSSPPVVRYLTRSKSGAWDVDEDKEPADQIGESLSASLVLLIGGIIERHDSERCPECLANPLKAEDTTRYGPRHPVRRALADFERICRKRHQSWYDHQDRPICAIMLREMLEYDYSLAYVAEGANISYPRAERLVMTGAAYVWKWVDHWDHESLKIPTDPDCEVCKQRKVPVDLRERRAMLPPLPVGV